MCLSKVYLENKKEEDLVGEEVARITREGESLLVRDLLGESRVMENCFVREINFMDNFVILGRKQEG
ncbi:MAG: CooT family nickel-binding protein [Candidatus Auribacterota bacterium]|nr:CooT family nickel-binding protein [Candidatus Auribacterota bacterium]